MHSMLRSPFFPSRSRRTLFATRPICFLRCWDRPWPQALAVRPNHCFVCLIDIFMGISWGFHGINEGWIWVSKYGEMEYWWDIHDILLMGISWKNHGDIMDIYQQLGSYPPMLSLPWLDNPPANLAVKNPQLANAVVDNWTPFFSGSWGFPMFPFFAYRERTYIYLKMTTSVVPRSQDPYLSSQVLASHLDDHWS